MKQTTNYSLNKIELTDAPPDITVLNPNFDKIDAELKNLSNGKAPTSHQTVLATEEGLGHVSLSDSVSSTEDVSGGTAATPKAVKTAYDKATVAQNSIDAHDDVKGNATTLGHVKLSDGTRDTSDATSGVAASPKAVKTVNDIATAALPKAGGTMTGDLTMATDTRIQGAATDNRLFLAASPNAPTGGATIELCGEDHPQPGVFYLHANIDSENQYLVGKPNGELKWNDKHLVRSVNNVNADANGNVSISTFDGNYNNLTNKPTLFSGSYNDLSDKPSTFPPSSHTHSYLPLSGGTMTSATAMIRNVDTDALQLYGGTSSANGAGVWLYGKSKTDLQGVFRIRATANGENKDLIGYPNGTLKWNGASLISVGELKTSLTSVITGFLLCDGSAVSRTTYSALFAIIGTSFGAGNGSTTFNLPDFRNRTLWGAKGNLKSYLSAGLPNIKGTFSVVRKAFGSEADPTGAFSRYSTWSAGVKGASDDDWGGNYDFYASRSSSVYGNSTTVQPPAIAVNVFIKY